MIDLIVLQGSCTIQVYRKVSGNNKWSHTIVWEICDNTLVDECDFNWLNQHRWLRYWNPGTHSYYVIRHEKTADNKWVNIYMSREILGLSVGAGHAIQGDHKDYDTRNNRRDNLRVATPSQNQANTRKYGVKSRFKGVNPIDSGFQPYITYNYQRIYFPVVKLEIEAGLAYFYAGTILFKDFVCLDVFPEDEMPSEETQNRLYQMVVGKLRAVGLLVEAV